MAKNFYYRESKIKADDIYTNNRLRNNAFVRVTAKDPGDGSTPFQLPVTNTTFQATYNPNGTGRPAPILKDVKLTLEGTAGSLRRATVSFTCFDKASFQKAEKAILVPGSEVIIKYGYTNPENSTQQGEYLFRVYDYSFKMTKENNFECSFKAVAPGTGADSDSLNINGLQAFPAEEFVTDYDGGNDVTTVSNIFDYIDWQVQKLTGELNTSAYFNPSNGTCGKLEGLDGHFGVLTAPKDYDPPTKMGVGKWASDRIIYITLEGIVSIINKFILKPNKRNYKIKFDDDYSAIDYQFPAGKVWSPSPSKVLIPYVKGTQENRYGSTFSCDSFAAKNSTVYNQFRVDAVGIKGVLIGRDVLKEIANSLDEKAASEDDTTEETEKANSSLNLIDFFKKIFASIRENTGGDWNFSIEIDDKKREEGDEIPLWIVNKNSPEKAAGVFPLKLDPRSGRNGVREMSIEGSVPKSIQASAFGGSPNVTREQKSADVLREELEAKNLVIEKEIEKLKTENQFARFKLHLGNYDSDATTAAKGIVKRLVTALTVKASVEKNKLLEPTPYPLKLSLTVDGIEGFSFGDTISSDYLPDRYTKTEGVRIVFTVTKYTHEFKGNDWTTSVESMCRMVGD